MDFDLNMQPEHTLQPIPPIHPSKTHCFSEARSLALWSFHHYLEDEAGQKDNMNHRLNPE